MVEPVYLVIWDNLAMKQFREIYIYIRNDSHQTAELIKSKILEATSKLNINPRRYNADKLRINKDQNFRAFEIEKIRVSYYIDEGEKTVNIIGVRSARQQPLEH